MAGFLGTLFMGNVGLRLLTPPRSAYSKMASDFGNGARKIALMGNKEHKKGLDLQDKSTQGSILRSQQLLRTARKTNATEDIVALKNELMHLDALTDGAVSNISQALGNAPVAALGVGGSTGVYDDILGGLDEVTGGIEENLLGGAIDNFTGKIEGLIDGALQRFNQSLNFSVMALTAVGFQVQQTARDLITYEKELVNANSIFQVSNDELYSISNEVVDVGLQYALTYDNMSQALYQFASAGLDAAESQQILADVMKLSMAVQGDSETLGKLMIQTLKGFGLEFSESAKLADQFALAINESLLEYQDLASAVKFAMPFFVSTNQGVEQLLGGLAILTDRALEAGIAGRGLRQALAELAESLGENTRKFQQMGINITDSSGNLLQMTEIAQEFNRHFGEAANDTELLTTLISDLNVRGATAFVHLVQNANEFAEVTEKIANAQGDSTRMADVQMESLTNQIQITKNAMKAVFLYGEVQEDGTMGVNAFHEAILDLVKSVRSKFVIEMGNGKDVLTLFAFALRDGAVRFVEQLNLVLIHVIDAFVEFSTAGFDMVNMLELMFMPLKIITTALDAIPDSMQPTVISFFLLSRMVGFTGAAFFMIAGAFNNFIYEITGGNEVLTKTVGLITALAGGLLVIAGLAAPVLGGIFGGPVGAFAGLNIGSSLLGVGAGALVGGGAMMAMGPPQKTETGDSDFMASYNSYLEETAGFTRVSSFNGSPSTLNVDQLNVNSDNLDEAFYSSQYAV